MKPMIRRPQDARYFFWNGNDLPTDSFKEVSRMLHSPVSLNFGTDAASWANNTLSSGLQRHRPLTTTGWDK